MADAVPASFWLHALESACPEDHTYKLALYGQELDADAEYGISGEISGLGYDEGGQVLAGRKVELDEQGRAWLKFDRFVMWADADISTRSALVYDATDGRTLRVIDFGRRVGVQGGLFEVKLPAEGVVSMGAQE